MCGGGEELVQNHRDVGNMALDSALLEHKASGEAVVSDEVKAGGTCGEAK